MSSWKRKKKQQGKGDQKVSDKRTPKSSWCSIWPLEYWHTCSSTLVQLMVMGILSTSFQILTGFRLTRILLSLFRVTVWLMLTSVTPQRAGSRMDTVLAMSLPRSLGGDYGCTDQLQRVWQRRNSTFNLFLNLEVSWRKNILTELHNKKEYWLSVVLPLSDCNWNYTKYKNQISIDAEK